MVSGTISGVVVVTSIVEDSGVVVELSGVAVVGVEVGVVEEVVLSEVVVSGLGEVVVVELVLGIVGEDGVVVDAEVSGL